MNQETSFKKPIYKRWWFIGVMVLIVLRIIGGGGSKDTPVVASNTNSNPDVQIQLPTDQQKFIEIVKLAQEKSTQAENDMAKGGIKMEREQAICKVIKGTVSNWVGTINQIDANSDGKGVLSIELASGLTVKTWNNDVSDYDTETLLLPNSPLFLKVSQMKVGQTVKFNGNFFKAHEDTDCLTEGSLSLDGKIKEPEFIFKFSSVDLI